MKKLYAFFILFFVLVSSSPCFSHDIPEGFAAYRIRAGDTLSKIAPHAQWEIIMQVNRIDEKHLPLGKIILLPADLKKTEKFLPLPKNIPEKYLNNRLIYISSEKQFFGVYERGELIFWGPISSGRVEYKTPVGKFKILWKAREYRSKKYEAPMPLAINISPAGYFIHHQALPGRPASHGCIRLLYADAKKLFEWSKVGDAVVIE